MIIMKKIILLFSIALVLFSCDNETSKDYPNFSDFYMTGICRQLEWQNSSGTYENVEKTGNGIAYQMFNQGSLLGFFDMSRGMSSHKFQVSEGCEILDEEFNSTGEKSSDKVKIYVKFNTPGVQSISVYNKYKSPFKFAYVDYRQKGTNDVKLASGGCYSAFSNGVEVNPGDIVDGDLLFTIYFYVKELTVKDEKKYEKE